MKRAIINIMISAHELVGHELRELVPYDTLKDKGVPIATIVSIDGEDEEDLCRKIREWLAITRKV